MTDTTLPVLGAALPVASLDEYRDWILADQRDIEIQDACLEGTLDLDWKPLALVPVLYRSLSSSKPKT